jgi:hypothetical protein
MLQHLTTLDDVVMLVRAYEQRNTITVPAGRVQGRGAVHHTVLPAPTTGPTHVTLAAIAATKPTANVKRISPT